MKWPWSRTTETETRADTFTDRLLEQRVNEANGTGEASNALAVIEACASLYGRAVAAFRIEAEGWTVEPHELEAVGRSVLLNGQAMLIRSGGVSNSWTVYGQSPDPSRWTFDVTVSSPDGTRTRRLAADQVALVRINPVAATPWRGQSPLVGARTTVALAAKLEQCLTSEHNAAVGAILAVPSGTPQDALNSLRDDLRQLGGRTALVESTRGGWGDGQRSQPQRDWQQQRIGPETPAADVELRQNLERGIFAAAGIPPSLWGVATGQESREAWRQFVVAVMQPLANQMQRELRRSAPAATVRTEDLGADELSQRARAFGSLVNGGMSVADAVAASGLLLE